MVSRCGHHAARSEAGGDELEVAIASWQGQLSFPPFVLRCPDGKGWLCFVPAAVIYFTSFAPGTDSGPVLRFDLG